MRAEVVSDQGPMLSLRAAWQQLLEASPADPVFLSPDFAAAWWAAYGRAGGGRLHVVCVRDGGGGLVGLAPLYRAAPDERGQRVVRLLGSGGDTSPDYLGVIARPGCERAVAVALAEHLAATRGDWDALLLTDLAQDLAITDALEEALAGRGGLLVRRAADAVCPYAMLPRSVEAHRAGLPTHLRRLVSQRERLAREHGARFLRWPEPGSAVGETLAHAMEQLAALHQQRFTAKGEAHAFSSPAYLDFHRRLAAEWHRRGMLRLFALEVDGRVAAMLYGCRLGRRFYYLQAGFDPAWARAQVGKLLLSHVLEHSIGEGVRCFDFLKGEHAYKDEWASGKRYTVRLVAVPRSVAGVRRVFREVWRPRLSERWQALRAAAAARRGLVPALLNADAAWSDREPAKYALAGALYHTGLMAAGLRLLRLLDGESRLVVLAYHRVLPEELRLAGDTTSIGRRHFDDQARVLARLLRHPAPAAALDELRHPALRTLRYPMLSTFDDGHANVCRHAWPALRRRGLPLVFCVATGACGTEGLMWPDEVAELLVHAPLPALRLRVGGREEVHVLGSAEERLKLAERLKRRMKALPHEEFARFLGAVRAACGAARYRMTERSALADWDDLERLRREGVVLASHSHEHAVLSRLPREALTLDVQRSAAELARRTGVVPRYFAYPNGLVDDISDEVVAAVRAHGFSHAFTMMSSVASASDDPLRLPRIAPTDRPGVMVGLTLTRQLAAAVVNDTRRDWRARFARALGPPLVFIAARVVPAPPPAAAPPAAAPMVAAPPAAETTFAGLVAAVGRAR